MRPDTRIIDLTVSQLQEIIRSEIPKPAEEQRVRRLAYGLDGIAEIFGCSRATAQRIKNSGVIDKAITQVGRKIVVDVDRALKLYRA